MPPTRHTLNIEPNEQVLKASPGKRLTRKEKLSTKQYFEEWAKFEDNSDDDECIEATEKSKAVERKEVPVQSRTAEMDALQKMIANNELQQAERGFLSNREREKGNEYFKCNENESAMNCYSKSILLDPANAKSYSNRAAVFLRLGRKEEAIEDCTSALRIDPNYIKALARRGMILHQLKRYEEAVKDFKACQALDPTGGYNRLQESSQLKLQEQRMTRLTIEEVHEEEEIILEEVFTPGALSESTSAIDISEKKSSMSERLSIDEIEEESWQKISIVEVSESDEDNRSDDQDSFFMRRVEIIEEETDNEQHALLVSNDLKEKGNAAMKLNRFDEAIKLYTSALEHNSRNSAAYNNRCQAYIGLSQYEQAIKDATSCLRLEPQNTKALYRRGCAIMMRKDEPFIKSAQTDFETALSFNPPKDQRSAVSKKLKECERLLQEGKRTDPRSSTAEKPKIKSHDSSALCF